MFASNTPAAPSSSSSTTTSATASTTTTTTSSSSSSSPPPPPLSNSLERKLELFCGHFEKLGSFDQLLRTVQYSAFLVSSLAANGTRRHACAALADAISEARTLNRAMGTLESVLWLIQTKSMRNSTKRRLTQVQAFSMILYHPLELIAYLGAKKVLIVPGGKAKIAQIERASCAAWLVYIIVDIVLNSLDYKAKAKTLAMDYAKSDALLSSTSNKNANTNNTNTNNNFTFTSARRKLLLLHFIRVFRNIVDASFALHWSIEGSQLLNARAIAALGTAASALSLATIRFAAE